MEILFLVDSRALLSDFRCWQPRKLGGIEKAIRFFDKEVVMGEKRLSEYMTIRQVAEMLNVSVGTVRNEIKRGRLRVACFGKKDRAVRVIRESIAALVGLAKGGNDA